MSELLGLEVLEVEAGELVPNIFGEVFLSFGWRVREKNINNDNN